MIAVLISPEITEVNVLIAKTGQQQKENDRQSQREWADRKTGLLFNLAIL